MLPGVGAPLVVRYRETHLTSELYRHLLSVPTKKNGLSVNSENRGGTRPTALPFFLLSPIAIPSIAPRLSWGLLGEN